MEVFAKHGMEFRMEQVAALAGVSKQAIYRRWASKLDLITHAIEMFVQENIDTLPRKVDPPEKELRDFAWYCFNSEVITANRMSIFLQSESFRNDALLERMRDWHGRLSATYVRHLQILANAGILQSCDVGQHVGILMDLLSGASANLALARVPSEAEKQRVFENRWMAFHRMAIKTGPTQTPC